MVGQYKEDISDCRGLMDVAMSTSFGQNRQKYHKNDHICDILPLAHSALNPCKLIDTNSTLAYERKTAKINVKKL